MLGLEWRPKRGTVRETNDSLEIASVQNYKLDIYSYSYSNSYSYSYSYSCSYQPNWRAFSLVLLLFCLLGLFLLHPLVDFLPRQDLDRIL
jgi:hypothetical protein